MKVFITGATGYIGSRLAMELAEKGSQVHALCRSAAKAVSLAHPNITVFSGSIHDRDAMEHAMRGCRRAFHLAAAASVWEKDPELYHRVNVEGTESVLELAGRLEIERLVYTSTAGTLGPSDGKVTAENDDNPGVFFSEYDRTKAEAERRVLEYSGRGVDTVVVNPSRVYGPSVLNAMSAVNSLIRQYIDGRWRFLPGKGEKIGNYVYIDDVIGGHLLAMEKGRSGERYLLGGSNLSYREFFDAIGRETGRKRFLLPVPVPVMLSVAGLQLVKTALSGRPPRIVPGWVRRFAHDWKITCAKAERELGYRPGDIKQGMKKTVEWMRTP